ncbi:hypothetical protein VL15_04745 [Burkholderia cepacia]|uniref:Uncharacterized protein n=1 Tax=Burkholderia cepacia TaxID=292 RepID=A0A0J6A7P5_BURCE|nr:hypothetical protein VL15_04745 [Burkholderia cepacia]
MIAFGGGSADQERYHAWLRQLTRSLGARLVDGMGLSAAILDKIRFALSATGKLKVPRKLMPSM